VITALFGGSFDPVHKGHINAVNCLLQSGISPDRVIIMPAYVNPFKAEDPRKGRADCSQRLEMCRIAFADIPKCTVSDFEIKKGTVSYTAETLEYLREIYPNDRLILTVGSDSLASLPRWYRFGDIIGMADIAAVSRSREETDRIYGYSEVITKAGGRVTIIDADPFEISSTEIREKIVNNQDISCYMDKNVVEYIMCNSVYR